MLFPETFFIARGLLLLKSQTDKWSEEVTEKAHDIYIFPLGTSFAHCMVYYRKSEILMDYHKQHEGNCLVDQANLSCIQLALL